MAFYENSSMLHLLLFFILIALATSSSIPIYYSVFESHEGYGRSLLQAKKPCNVSFQSMDYSVLTKNCKGPKYPVKECCMAFKKFACPHASDINDMSTDCATVMFSYINLYGKYPPGLFSNACKEGKQGLECTDDDIEGSTNNGGHTSTKQQSLLLIITTGLLVILLLQLS